MPVILATQKVEIRRIPVQVCETISKKPITTGGVAQGVGPEFKP
jgi:hypothetical protein